MTICRAHFILAAFFLVSAAHVRTTDARGKLQFTVDLRNTASGSVHVTLLPTGFTNRSAVYQMPVWAPGAYSVTHYGRYLRNVHAYDSHGHALDITQINDDRWQIAKGNSVAKIEYDVLDSHADSTSLYFAMANIDTGIFFANATALFGYYDDDKSIPSQVTYLLPEQWKLACPLDAGKSSGNSDRLTSNFIAKDYDELADAPILAATTIAPDQNASNANANENHSDHLLTARFHEGSADYDVAVVTDGMFSEGKMDSLVYYLHKIVHAETDFFHDTPFKHYTFEIVAPTLSRMPSFAQGALEHANSSDYLLVNLGWTMFKGAFLSIFSHEFFHLWNVKRIHSTLLGPFDYTQRVMTKSLWMAEGITEYYAHTLLARYGMESADRFYEDIEQWRKEMASSPPDADVKSLEQLSIDESDFHLDEATLFYSRGPLVALMLDIEIRERTNNKKSLDDVMLALDDDAKHGKTFREEDLIKTVEEYAGCDLTDFYDKYIKGTDSLPIDAYMAKMGVSLAQTSQQQTKIALIGDGVVQFQSIDPDGPLGQMGVKGGDELSAINGTNVTRDNISMLYALDSLKGGTITVLRNGTSLNIPIQFSAHRHRAAETAVDPSAPPLAAEIRKGIVGE